MKQKIMQVATAITPVALLGATVTSGGVSLAASDVTGIGGALISVGGTMLDSLVSFAPYIAGFAGAMMLFRLVKGWANLRRR